jgi:penicillin-binding protein 1A
MPSVLGRRSPVIAVLAPIVFVLGAGCAYEIEPLAPAAAATSTKVFAADGTLITTLHAEVDREPVALAEIAPALRHAVVAIEDARFFSHKGVDLRALARALRRNAQAGEVREGGSTITQQYVKNTLLDPEQTVHRKLSEAVLALQLERRHSKETILERYLNRIYLGNGAYGVQAAAGLYFNKAASELALSESALLAGLIAAPERYDPLEHPAEALARRRVVLGRMEELGMVGKAEAAEAEAAPLGVTARSTAGRERYPAGHFVEAIKRLVLSDARFGATRADRRRLLFEDGLRIHTTLDLRLQRLAEEAVTGVLAGPEPPAAGGTPGPPAGAVVVLDPANGFVRALVGGQDFFGPAPEAKFDLATQGRRQSGSAFKPFVLAAALAEGVPLDRTFEAPGSLTVPLAEGQPAWTVENYEGSGGPPQSLLEATVASVNTVYAQLIMQVGPKRAIEMARKLGIRSPLRPFPSAVLGTNEVTVLDMAAAYSSFAADGMHSEPVLVTEITRADGSVLYRRPSTRQRVLAAEVARRVTAALSEVVTRGTGVRAGFGRPAAGKTGTAQQWRDAWFVGYTPDLVGAVWVGFPDALRSMEPPATPMRVTGGSWPAEIWRRVMEPALAGLPIAGFPAPPEATAPAPLTAPVTVPVPDVEGLAEADARARLEAAGFLVKVEARASRELPPGTVIEQAPGGGALAAPGTGVSLGLSSGPPRTVLVPSLMGLGAGEAARLVREAGLAAEVVVEGPPEGVADRPGRVWKQAPTPGTSLDEGQPVWLWAGP